MSIPSRTGAAEKHPLPPSVNAASGKLKKLALVLAPLMILASGFYTVETGFVAVEKTLGRVDLEEIGEGVHWRMPGITGIYRFSTKSIPVDLNDLSPKAADNLSLRDLDVSLYYRVDAAEVAEMMIKYSGAGGAPGTAHLPAYALVVREARGVTYDAVAEIESLRMHRERTVLADAISGQLQARLESDDPGIFSVDRVVIRALNTDPTIEASIQLAVQNQKKLEAKQVEVEIAEKDAEIEIKRAEGIAKANSIINQSLTAEYLQHEVNMALQKYGDNGCPATVIPANMEGINLLQTVGNKP